MPYKVIVTAQAEEDLQEVADYLYPFSESASRRMVASLNSAYLSLGDFPNRGRSRDDLLPGLRHLVVGEYLIFYHIEAPTVFVDRILHGMRDLSAIFGNVEAERN